MDAAHLADLLNAKGAAADVVLAFRQFAVTGGMVLDGISDEELKEMGIVSALKCRGIKSIMEIIQREGTKF